MWMYVYIKGYSIKLMILRSTQGIRRTDTSSKITIDTKTLEGNIIKFLRYQKKNQE